VVGCVVVEEDGIGEGVGGGVGTTADENLKLNEFKLEILYK
jgi:hypothetical protein